MNFFINKIADYIENVLKSSVCGTVHSVYRKTINLSFNGQLAALQAEGSPLSPISLITNLSPADMEGLHIRENDYVKLGESRLEIHSAESPSSEVISFSYADADRHCLRLSGVLSPKKCAALAQNIRNVLILNEKGGFQILFHNKADAEASLVLLAAKKRIETCTSSYYSKHYFEAAGELSRLLGLGSGLTPSGDDFLCGVLAGLKLSGMDDCEFGKILKSEIKEHLNDTIDISAAFLSCAIEGEYSLAVNRLYNVPKMAEIFSDFSAIGHSSGMDTLCGVLYALELNGIGDGVF